MSTAIARPRSSRAAFLSSGIYSCLSPSPTPLAKGVSGSADISAPIALVADVINMANAVSGMAVNDDCKLKFLELKAKRTYRFIIYKIDEKQKEVLVEKLGEPNLTYDDFTASLPANECRYAIYDFDFVTEENCQKSKIFFIAWSPDTSRVRSKMLYASSKERFKRELDGIQVELQATDPTEMGLDVIKGRAN
ncbi:actin-depolymerizing factor 7-like [Zingiber officinale]|uniref:ADF-H domain-containing protein n=2 Tax=Zingiber officinale TaxID=94328 RepID=A0A8J5GFE2_ZINOF|nr:actin-depolymerizing factor 7-like [Zingiber officinale]KAG6506477.1 hypothetical protein ZIOFF_031800 [Zingiber officinale]